MPFRRMPWPDTEAEFAHYLRLHLRLLYLGLPVEGTADRKRCSIYTIFIGSVLRHHQDNRLDISIIHVDGTTAAVKKGGGNIGFNGHKVVVFCARHCNVIAPPLRLAWIFTASSSVSMASMIVG
jgi:hypothetical protein